MSLALAPNPGMQGVRAAMGALYHPKVYKHRFCASYPHIQSCRRGTACAFAHSREEIRTPLLSESEEAQRGIVSTSEGDFDYGGPLPESRLPGKLQADFLSP